MVRLQKFLADAGIASRRKCEQLIVDGKIEVNGTVITELGTKIDISKDKVVYNKRVITLDEKKVYILLNKPKEYITSSKDPEGRKTVLDLVTDIKERVYPVGRLDYDTEGLLILTNDGDLAYRLTHPKYHIVKTYEALVKGKISKESINLLEKGILLEDGMTAPAKVRVKKEFDSTSLVELKIHEGRNHQVKRMLAAVSNPVLRLKRTSIGELEIGNLKLGEYRFLTKEEISNLGTS